MNINDLVIPETPVIDIGAHLGDKTEEYLSLGASVVVAVEMQFTLAAKLIRRFSGRPVVVVCAAVTDKPGQFVQIKSPESESTIATITDHWQTGRFSGYAWKKDVKVPTITLPGLCVLAGGNVSFIKVDVEGAERLVVAGLGTSFTPRAISFEYTYEFLDHAEEVANHFYGKHYDFSFTVGESTETVIPFCERQQFLRELRQHCPVGGWGCFIAKRNR